GTFTYAPAAGTKLNAGNGQALHVDFTPTDTTNFKNASKDVTINVLQTTTTISVNNIPSGAIIGGSFSPTYAYLGDGVPSVTSSAATASICTVSAGSVKYVGVGTCTITANATAGLNYTATTGTPQSFTIGLSQEQKNAVTQLAISVKSMHFSSGRE